MVKNLNAKASFNPTLVKNETIKNSEIRAKARNKSNSQQSLRIGPIES